MDCQVVQKLGQRPLYIVRVGDIEYCLTDMTSHLDIMIITNIISIKTNKNDYFNTQ